LVEVGGLFIVIISAALMLILPFFKRKGQTRITFRQIPALKGLQRAIGLAVEEGKRVHVTLGKSNLLTPTSASSFAGLSTLELITQSSMMSDRPPLATSGDGALALLSQDTLQKTYRAGNAIEQYNPNLGRLSGATPMSYVAGVLADIYDERISAHVFSGNFGAEIGLLNEAAEQEKAFVAAASDSLPAQSVLYAVSKEPLIGEELFAIPAYLKGGKILQSSVITQDILRWGVIVLLIGAALLRLLGIL
jgi:hypothetical protein